MTEPDKTDPTELTPESVPCLPDGSCPGDNPMPGPHQVAEDPAPPACQDECGNAQPDPAEGPITAGGLVKPAPRRPCCPGPENGNGNGTGEQKS